MRRAVAAAIVAAATLALALPLPAAAATGADARVGAPELWLGVAGRGTADTTSYSVEAGEPLTTGPQGTCPRMAKTAWWTIRGNGHTLVISTAGSDMDTELAVYDGGTLLKCHTDVNPPNDRTSIVSIQNTVRGHLYNVQVGSQNRCADSAPCYDSGDAVVSAAGSPRPANDDRAEAITLPANPTASADNTGATTEPGEATMCGSAPLSATLWFRWVAPATGAANFDARAAFSNVLQSANTVLAVYRAGDGARLGCNDDAAEFAGGSRVTLAVSAGDVFLLQIGAYGQDGQLTGEGPVTAQVSFQEDLDLDDDGAVRPGDCNDANPAIHPGAVDIPDNGVDEDCNGVDAVDLDRDRDGYARPKDCRDDRPDINPGAIDKPGDGIDQDCADGDAPWPELSVGIAGGLALFPRYTKFTELSVSRVPAAGTRVLVTCRGRGCPLKVRTIVAKRAMRRLDLLPLVKKAKLRRGAKLEVRVMRKGYVGRLARWTTRAPKKPQRIDRCLLPRTKRPVRC